ncbi:MAG: hypothetical protein K5678_00310 [Acetatifactor sp.]|nr:hypothetical protein [Acetatifactor sp.]
MTKKMHLRARAAGLWRDKSGKSTPLAGAVVIALRLLMLVITEGLKIAVIMSGVKDAFEEAVISVVTENYNETYHCVREGYAGGYEPTGAGFYESLDLGDVRGRLSGLLGLTPEGDALVKKVDGQTEYRVSGIATSVQNTHLRTGGEKFTAQGELLLEIPVRFEGREVYAIPIRIAVKALMREKF